LPPSKREREMERKKVVDHSREERKRRNRISGERKEKKKIMTKRNEKVWEMGRVYNKPFVRGYVLSYVWCL
jgi:hypothetical protein